MMDTTKFGRKMDDARYRHTRRVFRLARLDWISTAHTFGPLPLKKKEQKIQRIFFFLGSSFRRRLGSTSKCY